MVPYANTEFRKRHQCGIPQYTYTRSLILHRISKPKEWSGWDTWLELRILDYQERL